MVDDSLIKGDIVFNAKPDAVPYNYRISYKVSQLCLIMRLCGWGDSCSLIKLQMISYALFSEETMVRLVDFADGVGPAPIVRFDPAVNKGNRQISRRMDTHGIIVVERFATFHYY